MKKVICISFALLTLSLLCIIGCNKDKLYDKDLKNNTLKTRSSVETARLDSLVDSLAIYFENRDSILNGILYSSIENGTTIDSLYSLGYLSSTFINNLLSQISIENGKIVNQHGESFLETWYENKNTNLPIGGIEAFPCIICIKRVTGPCQGGEGGIPCLHVANQTVHVTFFGIFQLYQYTTFVECDC